MTQSQLDSSTESVFSDSYNLFDFTVELNFSLFGTFQLNYENILAAENKNKRNYLPQMEKI